MYKLICICSKSPNPQLYDCIVALYQYQIRDDDKYKICIIDSDSDNLTNYEKVNEAFPNVEICFIKNKNYEYGAWKYAVNKYPDYDAYFCIQDTIIIRDYINLDILTNDVVYTYHNESGYYSHREIKQKGINKLINSGLNYNSIIDTSFNLATHNIFIVNNNIMKDIFTTLTMPPIDKEESCVYERNFGIYFILKNINTINIADFVSKSNGGRQ